MQHDNGGPCFGKERLTSLIPVLEPREECTLPTLIELLEDCEISDSDAIKDKEKASLECMKGKTEGASFQKHFLPRLKLAYTRHGGEAIYCRGVSRPATQRLTGKKEGQVNHDSYNGQGAWRPWSFSLTEEDDDRGGSRDLRFLATRMENEAGVRKQP